MRPRWLVVATLIGGVLLVAADLASWGGSIRARRAHDGVFYTGYGEFRDDLQSRGADDTSELALPGLWSAVPVQVRIMLGAKEEEGRRVRIYVNAALAAETELGPELRPVELRGLADAGGRLVLRFAGGRRPGVVLRVGDVTVRQLARGGIPAARLLQYLLLASLLAALPLVSFPERSPRLALVGTATALALAGAVIASRMQTLADLPLLAVAAALAVLAVLLADPMAARLGLPRTAARWILLGLVLRVGAMADLRFESVDAVLHAHNLERFREGQVISSDAPGVEVSPYPPALYALLWPFATSDALRDLRVVRLGMGLLEGTAPLLVLALMLAGNAPPAAAAGAAIAAAVLPEGLLVLAKGIGCNILCAYATLLAAIAVLRRASAAILTGLLALTLLSHAAGAVSFLLLLAVWSALEARAGTLDRRELLRRLACVAAAGLVAWAVYYREVPPLFSGAGPSRIDPSDTGVVGVRWYRLGKLAQDVVLKFGLGPAVLAVVGWRARHEMPERLRTLLEAWMLAAGALGLFALSSRFPLRFEYFAAPAVAALAGIGSLAPRCPPRRAAAFWAGAFAVQLAIGAFVRMARFEIISVIMESPRWPFPFRL